MRYLILLSCFIFSFMVFYNTVSYGFSFDVDKFTVKSGTSKFVDEFDDGIAPPSGPSGPSTYGVLVPFSANAESGGVLNWNSNDAVISDGEIANGLSLIDNTYNFIAGSGGFAEVKLSFPGGFTTNSFFDLEISSPPSDEEAVEIHVEKDTSGTISAFFSYGLDDGINEVDIDISEIDITSLLGTTTDLTMRLDISIANLVTASLDIGSDGSFDVLMPGSQTLTFLHAPPYMAELGAGKNLEPIPEPATIALLGIGLIGLAGAEVRRRRKKKAVDKS